MLLFRKNAKPSSSTSTLLLPTRWMDDVFEHSLLPSNPPLGRRQPRAMTWRILCAHSLRADRLAAACNRSSISTHPVNVTKLARRPTVSKRRRPGPPRKEHWPELKLLEPRGQCSIFFFSQSRPAICMGNIRRNACAVNLEVYPFSITNTNHPQKKKRCFRPTFSFF